MPAYADLDGAERAHPAPRESDLPVCPVCADSMVAAEASAFLAENTLSYLWTCDTCGYGLVTHHRMRRAIRN